MQKWDYITANIQRVDETKLEDLLDIYGRQGWELVQVINNGRKLIFKKPLEKGKSDDK